MDWENRLIVFDAMVLCRFYRDFYQWEDLARILKMVTGVDMTTETLRGVANRISDQTRRFKLQAGLVREDDHLPPRFYQEALPETGKIIERSQMDRMRDDYYQERGWETPPE